MVRPTRGTWNIDNTIIYSEQKKTASYHIKEDNWILEIRILLCISNDSWLYNMASKIYVHLRSIHCGQIDSLHLTYTPEQRLENIKIQLKFYERGEFIRLFIYLFVWAFVSPHA